MLDIMRWYLIVKSLTINYGKRNTVLRMHLERIKVRKNEVFGENTSKYYRNEINFFSEHLVLRPLKNRNEAYIKSSRQRDYYITL